MVPAALILIYQISKSAKSVVNPLFTLRASAPPRDSLFFLLILP
jgi:hypothetical protein